MKFMMQRNTKGFTLIELLVVIAIIGILASTVLASLSSVRENARDAKRVQEAKQLQNALEIYRSQNALYPCSQNRNPGSGTCPNDGNGGSGSGVSVFSGSQATKDTDLMTALRYTPTPDTAAPIVMWYRTTNTNDRSGYSIRVYQESSGGTCAIHFNNPVNAWAALPPC